MVAVKLSKYLPPLSQVSREAIAMLAGTVLVAFVISRVPAVRELVRSNSLN